MERNKDAILGAVGLLLVIAAFIIGVMMQTPLAWMLLLLGTLALAACIYTGSRPYLDL
jgi:1,4-dihydroxy-2-naphthoate octaprenyltransferase